MDNRPPPWTQFTLREVLLVVATVAIACGATRAWGWIGMAVGTYVAMLVLIGTIGVRWARHPADTPEFDTILFLAVLFGPIVLLFIAAVQSAP
jgi:hypothetical protein